MSPPDSVAVIGAGIAGLAAAHELTRQKVPFTLYEASGRVGGCIRTDRREGWTVECGPQLFDDGRGHLRRLVRELGMAELVVEPGPVSRRRFVVRDGELRPIPIDPMGLFRSPLLSSAAKLRIMKEVVVAPGDDPEESLGELVMRRFGSEVHDYALEPFVSAVYLGDPVRMSPRHVLPGLQALEAEHGSVLRGLVAGGRGRGESRLGPQEQEEGVERVRPVSVGLPTGAQRLAEALGQALGEQIALDHRLDRVQTRPEGGYRLHLSAPDGAITADHAGVVLAAPAHALAKIVFDDDASLAGLAELDYAPAALVSLGYPRDQVEHPLDGFGLLRPGVEGGATLATVFASSLFPERAPEGHVLLTSFAGGKRQPYLSELREDVLVHLVRHDLEALLGITAPPSFVHVVRLPRAIPQMDVGHERFLDCLAAFERSYPGVAVIGNFTEHIAVPRLVGLARRRTTDLVESCVACLPAG